LTKAKKIDHLLDEDGKLKQLPRKYAIRLLAYDYLAGKFGKDVEYSEQEINAILSSWHTFGNYFTLRRGLDDSDRLMRLTDGNNCLKSKENNGR
jgi:hypothetical protein